MQFSVIAVHPLLGGRVYSTAEEVAYSKQEWLNNVPAFQIEKNLRQFWMTNQEQKGL